MMEPTPEYIDQLYLQKVERARQTPPERKFLAGARLYEYARKIAMSAIKTENPEASPEELRRIFQHRLATSRMLEDQR